MVLEYSGLVQVLIVEANLAEVRKYTEKAAFFNKDVVPVLKQNTKILQKMKTVMQCWE